MPADTPAYSFLFPEGLLPAKAMGQWFHTPPLSGLSFILAWTLLGWFIFVLYRQFQAGFLSPRHTTSGQPSQELLKFGLELRG